MADSLIVNISQLRSALARALDATEAMLGPSVPLSGDFYWHLGVQDAFDMANVPQAFTTGQVSDDLAEMANHDQGRVPEAAWHDLSHLIGVLRALELAARP